MKEISREMAKKEVAKVAKIKVYQDLILPSLNSSMMT